MKMKKIMAFLLLGVLADQSKMIADDLYIGVPYNLSNNQHGQLHTTMTQIRKDLQERNDLSLNKKVLSYTRDNKLHLYNSDDAVHMVSNGYISNGKVCLENGTLLGDYAGSFGRRPRGEVVKLTLAIQMMGTDNSWHNFPVFVRNATPAAEEYRAE